MTVVIMADSSGCWLCETLLPSSWWQRWSVQLLWRWAPETLQRDRQTDRGDVQWLITHLLCSEIHSFFLQQEFISSISRESSPHCHDSAVFLCFAQLAALLTPWLSISMSCPVSGTWIHTPTCSPSHWHKTYPANKPWKLGPDFHLTSPISSVICWTVLVPMCICHTVDSLVLDLPPRSTHLQRLCRFVDQPAYLPFSPAVSLQPNCLFSVLPLVCPYTWALLYLPMARYPGSLFEPFSKKHKPPHQAACLCVCNWVLTARLQTDM